MQQAVVSRVDDLLQGKFVVHLCLDTKRDDDFSSFKSLVHRVELLDQLLQLLLFDEILNLERLDVVKKHVSSNVLPIIKSELFGLLSSNGPLRPT